MAIKRTFHLRPLDREALPLGRHLGKRWYRVPVHIQLNDSLRCATIAERLVWVIASNAADAANWVLDHEPGIRLRPETEIHAYGPKGGHVQRYVGWNSAIWNRMEALYDSPR